MRARTRAIVLALLALALLPALARAETAAEKVYHLAPEEIESIGPQHGGKSEPTNKAETGAHPKSKAHGAARPSNGEERSGETTSEPEGEPGSGGSHKGKVGPPHKGGNRPPGGRGTGPKAAAGPGPKSRTSVAARGEASSPHVADSSASSGGSSPLVPVLIAVAVLAALSIGVVLYRERMRDRGPSAPA